MNLRIFIMWAYDCLLMLFAVHLAGHVFHISFAGSMQLGLAAILLRLSLTEAE
jgi:hypothetical protein